MANTNDPISDFLTRIRNAQIAHHSKVVMPGSKMRLGMAQILQRAGYVATAEFRNEGPQGVVELELRYDDADEPMITSLTRVSRPSRRVYVGVSEIPDVLNGLGIAILSTSKGLLTDKEARAAKVGGEVLCEIY
ncbi:30S ribosomal protein S8 [Bradymonas sediminis]|uniref:Small ribosomal subunit protein uS8 n=1 Tax=Bradymonas sediminis TaxID=1548548 RepID=A0A2Z4FH90_9DELT|nr:30S ribosomal protein S8 [Bradymonas sediminis]AWV87996.1 30S ribosomal protein S8 [Bradymonas sediminis]TDP77119.1 SSU ribosomal protein S8P [Bradymonas sediminis]